MLYPDIIQAAMSGFARIVNGNRKAPHTGARIFGEPVGYETTQLN
jgi:hypothetical protein